MKTKKNEKKFGFTLLEVSLFLALSGILLIGIISSTQRNISRQRYNNAVQEFAEFLRTAYSSITYVQNTEGDGRSNRAIYGKLIVFDTADSASSIIYTYDLVGNIKNSAEASDLAGKNAFEVLVGTAYDEDDNGLEITLHNQTSFSPNWGYVIKNEDGGIYEGALLIFRSPSLGSTYTYYLPDTEINIDDEDLFSNLINNHYSEFSFEGKADYYIDSDDRRRIMGDSYQVVRLTEPARNASAVSIVVEGDD